MIYLWLVTTYVVLGGLAYLMALLLFPFATSAPDIPQRAALYKRNSALYPEYKSDFDAYVKEKGNLVDIPTSEAYYIGFLWPLAFPVAVVYHLGNVLLAARARKVSARSAIAAELAHAQKELDSFLDAK